MFMTVLSTFMSLWHMNRPFAYYTYLETLPTNSLECSNRVWSRNGREGCSGMLHVVITQIVYHPLWKSTHSRAAIFKRALQRRSGQSSSGLTLHRRRGFPPAVMGIWSSMTTFLQEPCQKQRQKTNDKSSSQKEECLESRYIQHLTRRLIFHNLVP